jgi:hypothetical protein
MNEQAIQRFFESIIQQLSAVASPRIHLAIGLNVYVPSISSSSLQRRESAITVIKNSLVEVQSTIHYY